MPFNGQLVEDDQVPIDRCAAGHDPEEGDFAAVKHVRQHVGESFRIARHLQRDVEAFLHTELLHGIASVFAFEHRRRRHSAHFLRELKTIRIHIGDDDVTRAGLLTNGTAMQPMGPAPVMRTSSPRDRTRVRYARRCLTDRNRKALRAEWPDRHARDSTAESRHTQPTRRGDSLRRPGYSGKDGAGRPDSSGNGRK